MRLRLAGAFLFCVFVSVVGCSTGPKKYEVTGKVTYKGEPVEVGEIIFEKVPAGSGVDAGRITNGAFKVSVKEGTHIVRINGSKSMPLGPGETPFGDEKERVKQFLPKKHNAESTLQVEVHGALQRDFELKD